MENTVLILGAGFSKPYGYPTGAELVEKLIANGRDPKTGERSDFSKSLDDYGSFSIDKFLSVHKNHSANGISQIAREMLIAESISLLYPTHGNEDIIKFLLNSVEIEDFPKLRIVTFNYDRLLEWRFLKRLNTTHDPQSAYEAFINLKIEHIHGRMPHLAGLEIRELNGELSLKYGLENSRVDHADWARKEIGTHGSDTFKTIFSADDKPNAFAVDAIKWARRVFFLGFAFDKMNMNKLGINRDDIMYDWESKYVAGTAYGLSPVDKNEIEFEYPFLRERLFDLNARSLFANKFNFHDPTKDVEPSPNFVDRRCCEIYAIQERPRERVVNTISYSAQLTCGICTRQFTAHYERPSTDSPWMTFLPNYR